MVGRRLAGGADELALSGDDKRLACRVRNYILVDSAKEQTGPSTEC